MRRTAEILIARTPGQTRAALLDGDGAPITFLIDRDTCARPGAIHLGKVEKVAGERLFIRLETGETGVLPRLKGAPPGEGRSLLVQVTQAARPGKGPELTAEVALRGALVVLTPARPGVAVSKAIADKAVRDTLHAAVAAAARDGEGWVVRTAARDAPPAALTAEMTRLRTRWADIQAAMGGAATAPARLDSGPPAAATLAAEALAGGLAVTALWCDDDVALQETRAALPALAERVRLSSAREASAFERHDAEQAFAEALETTVPLPCGGRLIIEPTAALIACDVDAGPAAPPVANLEAAVEMARQMRLRNLSGQIVLDLIAVGAARRDQAVAALRALTDADPVTTTVHGATRLGLVEITRERAWPALHERIRPADPETAALYLLARALRLGPGADPLRAVCAPSVAGLLLSGSLRAARDETAARLRRPLTIKADPALAVDRFTVDPERLP